MTKEDKRLACGLKDRKAMEVILSEDKNNLEIFPHRILVIKKLYKIISEEA